MLKRLSLYLLLTAAPFLLSACFGSLNSGQTTSFKEQLYIDARLNFSIKHPLDWQRQQIPVSSLDYRPDTIIWRIQDPEKQYPGFGQMLIRAMPTDPAKTLDSLMLDNMIDYAQFDPADKRPLTHPAGDALILQGHEKNLGWMFLAIKGQKQDFFISINFPASGFDQLLPVFQDIVDSFSEVLPPELGRS